MFLLDTNALSEPVKKHPNPGFMAWFNSVNQDQLYISCLSIGELQKGVGLLVDFAHKKRLQDFVNETKRIFEGTTLNIDAGICAAWGNYQASTQKSGKTAPAVDSLIAAQCTAAKLTLVTRNVKDFESFQGLKILSPWS